MADIITEKNTLHNVFDFVDGDTRTINLDNPNDSITTADVRAWADFAKTNKLLIGDKTGAALDDIKSSKVIKSRQTIVDLS